MRTLPRKRRRGASFVLLLMLAAAGVCCRRANVPDKTSPEYTKVVRAFYVGLSALQVGDDVRAEAELKEATRLAPDEPAAWADLGLLYLRQRQFDLAAANLEKARTLAPDNAALYVLTGKLESTRGNSAEATRQFRRAAELDPRNLKALYALAGEVEREGGEGAEEEVLRLLEKILEAQPDNLSVQLDVARLAAKRGDAELFGRLMSRFDAEAAAWPPEAQEQLKAVRDAAAGANPRAAAPRVQFLRNVLVRLPEYRQSRLAVEDPPEILSEPFTRFIRLESPSPSPAPPDEALTFDVRPAQDFGAHTWSWAGAASLTGEGTPALIFADGREARLSGGVRLDFPGGITATPPSPAGIAPLDFDYDFKTDLATAGEGGFRLYRQESAASFIDVTEKTGLPAATTGAAYAGAWAADIEADGDLDIVLAAKDGAPVVLRNNGDGTFAELHPFEGVSGLRDFAWADFDGDGDPDAALLDAGGRLFVFTNERAGQFRPRPLPQGTWTAVALGVADLNNDGRFDLLVLGSDGVLRRLSDRDEGQGWETADVLNLGGALDLKVPPGGVRLIVADLDNNGGVDLLVSTPSGARAWLSDERGAFKPLNLPDAITNSRSVSVADADGDGRLDLVGVGPEGQAFVAAGRGSKNYHWQVIRPRAAAATGDQRINSFGVGGEMEIRSGLLVQKQPVTGPVVHFGLGEQTGADVLRALEPGHRPAH